MAAVVDRKSAKQLIVQLARAKVAGVNSITELLVLVLIATHPEYNVRKLSATLDICRHTATRATARLMHKKLAKKEAHASPYGATNYYQPTPKGEAVLGIDSSEKKNKH